MAQYWGAGQLTTVRQTPLEQIMTPEVWPSA
jgi:hypothetical protein